MFGLKSTKKLKEEQKEEIQSLKIRHHIEMKALQETLEKERKSWAEERESLKTETKKKLNKAGIFGG